MEPQLEVKINKFLKALNCPNDLAKGLGMTELVSAATLTPFRENKTNSVGRPFPRMSCYVEKKERFVFQGQLLCLDITIIKKRRMILSKYILMVHDGSILEI